MTVILDISRLISRIRHSTPSGVDRVEMAYARGLLGRYGQDLVFAAVHPAGRYGRIDRAVALSYLDELERRWSQEDGRTGQRSIPSILPWMLRLLPRRRPASTSRPVYVQVSPHHLTDRAKVESILAAEDARFLCMVHDLIPIEYPEYARPNGADLHQRRMETVAACANAVIVNSAATGRSLQPWLDRSGRTVAVHVGLLGTESIAPVSATEPLPDRPFFVCIGTIEPRKNHLLLLNLWRQFAETMSAADIPALVVIGRRGWENEQVLDMLDRCPALKDTVIEIAGCSDRRLGTLLRNARALLMPSFTEGFGMPIAEALSVGTPVICSNIAAHQEVGMAAPDYADPIDGPRWRALITDFAQKGPHWQTQMARLPAWHAPNWEDHMQVAAKAIAALAQS